MSRMVVAVLSLVDLPTDGDGDGANLCFPDQCVEQLRGPACRSTTKQRRPADVRSGAQARSAPGMYIASSPATLRNSIEDLKM